MYHKMRKLASFIFGTCLLGAASSCSESQFNITGKVICGHPIPAGTCQKEFQEILVAPAADMQKNLADL